MRTHLLVMVLAVCSVGFAQCPVKIQEVNLTGSTLSIHYTNDSELEINGIEFYASRPNAFDEVKVPERFITDDKVKSGKKKTNRWDSAWVRYSSPHKWRIWVNRVKFSDGTVWEDKGDRSCYADWH